MSTDTRLAFEHGLQTEFLAAKDDTKYDLVARVNGVAAKRGSSGMQFAGYQTLEQFYRGDQWDHDEPPGASQKTDNYCAVIVDNLSSIPFDDTPEINCPTDDPTDDVLEIKAELREKFLQRIWDDNNAEVEFDMWSKGVSLYGDGFLIGPYMEKVNKYNEIVRPTEPGNWKIRFRHVENPGSIRMIFADQSYAKIIGFVESFRMSLAKATVLYGAAAQTRGIKLVAQRVQAPALIWTGVDDSQIPQVNVEYWRTARMDSMYLNDQLLDWWQHDHGFVPLRWVKANYSPNYPYGKSDIEDVLDPQLSHNRTNNDLANLLKWISTVNFWGKNVEGMQALVAGLSRIYSVPDDGELHTFEKPGDPYVTNTYVTQRRAAIVEISGVSESLLSSSQVSNASGRALALAFQGTIRKLNPRIKRFRKELKELNADIMKLAEIYFPETKVFIDGDYRNEVYLPVTLLRNIVDTINKLQSGIISQETAMREAGVAQPKMEKKLMAKDLQDPVIGPQIARQPALLPRLNEGQNGGGVNPMPGPGNAPSASPGGAVAANNQQSSGAAPTPVTP